MATGKNRVCIINFIDGKSLKFQFAAARDEADAQAMAQAATEMMETKNFILQLEDQLMIIPASSIRSIVVSPAPLNMPKARIIRGRMINS
jgi:hypothetical protein